MTTLKEEILSKTLRGNKIKTPEDVVDEILEMIEKRIDKVEQEIPTCTAQDGRTTSFNGGQRKMIEKVKEILLK